MEEFKDRLIAARENAGLSQTALGEASDMASTQVSRYESGRAVPRRSAMQRLARALGVSYEWLAMGEGADRQLLVKLDTPKDGTSGLTIHGDSKTLDGFLKLAANAGVTPDRFLTQLVHEHMERLSSNNWEPVHDTALAQLSKRIQDLEERVSKAESGLEPLGDERSVAEPAAKPRPARKPKP